MASSKNAPGSMAITGADDGFQPLQEFSDNVTVRRDTLARRGSQRFPGNSLKQTVGSALLSHAQSQAHGVRKVMYLTKERSCRK